MPRALKHANTKIYSLFIFNYSLNGKINKTSETERSRLDLCVCALLHLALYLCMCTFVLPGQMRSLVEVVFASTEAVVQQSYHSATLSRMSMWERGRRQVTGVRKDEEKRKGSIDRTVEDVRRKGWSDVAIRGNFLKVLF